MGKELEVLPLVKPKYSRMKEINRYYKGRIYTNDNLYLNLDIMKKIDKT